MTRRIVIDPVTRLEGHGRIQLFLDDDGRLTGTRFQVPDFRGFESFCVGRPAEEMPRITQKICGVCPTAHHIASVKALDALFGVEPPPAGRMIRELMHLAFILEDHLLHFFFLGGPDIIAGPDARPDERDFRGVVRRLGREMFRNVLTVRRRVRELNGFLSGSPLYPVCGLPGGVSLAVRPEHRETIAATCRDALALVREVRAIFDRCFLEDAGYRRWIEDERFQVRTYCMGLVDAANRVRFYDGRLRVVDPDGTEAFRFGANRYAEYLEERVETWSYHKRMCLKPVGWRGLVDGPESGVYRVGALARLNAASGMATPMAQAEFERLYNALGPGPVHNALAYHWARLVEMLYAAEEMLRLAERPELTDPEVRRLPETLNETGVGVCEAPRGALIHHYTADGDAMIRAVNLVVATQHNTAAIELTVDRAARAFIGEGGVSKQVLSRIEMAYRAYDPCLACATH